jgi:hypothetical protein
MRIKPQPSDIELESIDAVVWHHGTTGISLACLGAQPCDGTLTISRSGSVLGSAGYEIGANHISVVTLTLNQLGIQELRRTGTLGVYASAIDSAGPSSEGWITLYAR